MWRFAGVAVCCSPDQGDGGLWGVPTAAMDEPLAGITAEVAAGVAGGDGHVFD
jgi:hypothetical protein